MIGPGAYLTADNKYSQMLNAMPSTNNGTVAGGLGEVLRGLLMGKAMEKEQGQRALDRQQQADAMRAMAEGMNAQPWVNPDTGQTAPNQGPVGGYQGATAALSGMADNPYAGRLASQLMMKQAEQRAGMDQIRAQADMDRQQKKWEWENKPRDPKTITTAEGVFVLNPDGSRGQRLGAPRQTGTTVNVNSGPQGIDYGDPPKDMVWARGEDGQILMQADAQGRRAPVAIPIAGGPVEADREASENQAAMRREQQGRYADVVTQDIDRVVDLVSNATIPVTGAGSLLAGLPGTTARDVAGLVDTVKANIGFDRLQQMREASPTGGALGQVSEFENRLLQATLGNLEQSQTQEQFLYNLRRVKDLYLDIVHGPGNRPDQTTPQQPQATPGGVQGEWSQQPPPSGISPDEWKFMTPEERALWQN